MEDEIQSISLIDTMRNKPKDMIKAEFIEIVGRYEFVIIDRWHHLKNEVKYKEVWFDHFQR